MGTDRLRRATIDRLRQRLGISGRTILIGLDSFDPALAGDGSQR